MFSQIALVSIITLFSLESLPIVPSGTQFISLNPLHRLDSSHTKEAEDRAEIQALLDENLNALNAENVERYMNTMHPDSPQFEITEKTVVYSIELFDLKYEINDWEILEMDDDTAKIRASQTTTKVAGEGLFRDNSIVAIHTLKKYKGEWKFWTSEIQTVEFLN